VPLEVLLKQLPRAAGLPLPAYASPGAAGMDLCAAVDDELTILPGATTAVPTGIAVALPAGLEGQVRPRSGLARERGVTVLNAPGTIDSDYRGEIEVLLINHSNVVYRVRRGDRIAQIVFNRVERAEWRPVEELPSSERAEGGFGHTGR